MSINQGVWKYSSFLSGLSVPVPCCGAQHTESLGLIWSAWDLFLLDFSVCILTSGVCYGRDPSLHMRFICVSHNFIHVAYYILSTLKLWLWSVMWNQIRYGFFLSKKILLDLFIHVCSSHPHPHPPASLWQRPEEGSASDLLELELKAFLGFLTCHVGTGIWTLLATIVWQSLLTA